MQFGIEIDVAAFEEPSNGGTEHLSGPDPSLGWTPPAPAQTIPINLLTDTVEVIVFNQEAGPVLAGAIELISPANKDRPPHRDAFVSKRAAYLQQGVGLVLVDVVTGRKANLHDELLARLGAAPPPLGAALYAAAYHPVERQGQPTLDVWHESLAVGRPLVTMPLWLLGGICLPVDLDATYQRTCREQRIEINSG